jgi:hypothetical protein
MTEVAELSAMGVDRFPLRKPLPKSEVDALTREILTLKKQLNAVILVHNYQVPEIQEIGDFVGDSLGLSQQAAKTPADVIVFCGVHFMAETAKILNPHKIVVLPDEKAGCSLEESCPADKLAEFQKTNPNFYTVTYINCSAELPQRQRPAFRAGRKPRRLGDGTDRSSHDALAGQLLRACRIPARSPSAREEFPPGRESGRAP